MLITGNVVSYTYMSELTQTTESSDTHEQEPDFDPSEGSPFVGQAGSIARQRFVESTPTQEDIEADKTEAAKKGFRKGVTVGVVASAVVTGAGFAAHEASKGPSFSETTNEYVVQPGDGLYDAAQDIQGIDSIDIRDAVHHIQVDPANVDVLSDGLQPGEIVIIPDSVE